MRRNTILIASLPLANALSLANFQDITSVSIPFTCQFIYDSQIPSCVVADFEDAGCSPECAASLGTVALSVSQACSNVLVNSNTLLGIVKNGGILQALCPKMQTTTTTRKATATPVQQTVPASVTLPTASPGVVVGTTSSKSTPPTAQPAISTTASPKPATKSTSSAVETATKSTSETTNAAPTSSQSADGSGSDGAATTSTDETSTSSANKAGQTQKAQPQSDSGGGSPFDISSNSGLRLGEGSMLACVVAVWAGIILGR